jgi:hypothetical protein
MISLSQNTLQWIQSRKPVILIATPYRQDPLGLTSHIGALDTEPYEQMDIVRDSMPQLRSRYWTDNGTSVQTKRFDFRTTSRVQF